MKAAAKGDRDIAALLVGAGANAFLQDPTGKTALDWARTGKHNTVAEFLEKSMSKAIAKQVCGLGCGARTTGRCCNNGHTMAVIPDRFAQADVARADALARLRRDTLVVNDEHIRRLTDALRTRGMCTPAILAIVRTSTLTRAKFNEATAAFTPSELNGFAASKPSSRDGSRAGSRVGSASGAGKRRLVPAMGKRVWEEGDPALPSLREKWATEPRYYLDAEELGFTALIKCSIECDTDAMMQLIAAGATVDLETAKGFTALSWACILGHRDVAFLLLRHGAIIDFPSITEGKTPLIHAAFNGRPECVLLLLQSIFDR